MILDGLDDLEGHVITYKGKTLVTSHMYPLSSCECDVIRQAYYVKPDMHLVYNQLASLRKHGNAINHITEYYVRHLMDKVKLYTPKWTIEEVFECDDLIRYFYSRIMASDKVYPKTNTVIDNIKTALRLSGGGVAMKPSNFPIKTVDEVLMDYNLNDRYYDFSCGWGVRMMSAMRNNVSYFGTEPNDLLVEQLKRIHHDYNRVNHTSAKIDIRCTGSEIFHPEWENTMGVCFSSPPYFNLEDYKIGQQSITNFPTYDKWLDGFMSATVDNCRRYLIDGGHLLINIKNYSIYKLYDDTHKICESFGLKYIRTLELNNITRPSAKSDLNTDESIMVYKKI